MKFFLGKSSQNSPILVLTYCGSIQCVFRLYKYVIISHYDLGVMSKSVIGLKQKA